MASTKRNLDDKATEKSNMFLGVILMIFAMLLIPLVDGLAKYLSTAYSPLYISWARYIAACLIIMPLALIKYGWNVFPKKNIRSHFLRTIFLMVSMTLYFMAIARIPMATAISAYFIGPIIATFLGIILLGERFTVRKIIALLLGFSGAMFVLQPQGELDAGIVLALGSGAFFAFYLIATRRASQNSDPVKTLVFQCFVGAAILTPQAMLTWSVPAIDQLHLFLAIGVLSASSHILSITAFRYAEASILAPLVYIELVVTSFVGFCFFGEIPGFLVWVGAGIIIISGLVLLQRPNNTIGR